MELIFTQHAKYRMKRRHIEEDENANTMKFPEKTTKIQDK